MVGQLRPHALRRAGLARALAPKWIDDDQAVVLHPPAVAGPAVIFVTRRRELAGATVNAINGVDGSRFWETRLGVPLAAPPIVAADATKAVAMTAAGALYEVPAAGLANRKLIGYARGDHRR